MEALRTPEITVETLWRSVLVTDARNSSRAYFSDRADEALVRIERDRALFAQIASAYGGEEVRDRGDGSMFAFCDPLAALRAAMAMQEEMGRLNAEIPEEGLRLSHRMGLHVGAVKLATTRLPPTEAVRRKISGDLVVTAARLEAICHPGEVCFSNDLFRAVRGKIDHEFRFLDATLKGFERPMRCWSTRLDREWARPLTAEEEQSKLRREEERRLRLRWERESRDRRRREIALRAAAWCAAASVSFAGIRVLQTATDAPTRFGRAWTAFLAPAPETNEAPKGEVEAPSKVPEISRTSPERKKALASAPPKPSRLRRGSQAQVATVLRHALRSGQLEDLPVRLAALNLPAAEYQSVCDDAQRVERARDWLSARLESAVGDETQGLPLEPPVAGLTVLTRAEEHGVVGLDDADHHRSIGYADLAPHDFGGLLKAASGAGEAAPDDPASCARSLAALHRLIGRG